MPVCQERDGDAATQFYRKFTAQKIRLVHAPDGRRMRAARDDSLVANHDSLGRGVLFFLPSL